MYLPEAVCRERSWAAPAHVGRGGGCFACAPAAARKPV